MLDFKDGVFLIVGQNGAGKSSLLEAIVFSLYGVGVRYGKRSPLDYVRSGAEYCQVKFSFLRKGKKYEVVRRVRTKDRSSEALLLVNDKVVASQRSLVDEKLKEVMEASYESFISTFFLPQGMVSSLLTATRAKINEVVFDVLFEKKKLAKIIEKVSDAFKDAQRERDELLRRVNEMKDEIEKPSSMKKASISPVASSAMLIARAIETRVFSPPESPFASLLTLPSLTTKPDSSIERENLPSLKKSSKRFARSTISLRTTFAT